MQAAHRKAGQCRVTNPKTNQIHYGKRYIMSELIKLQNIKRHYIMPGFTVKALDGVDITIENNTFVALVGASGSGKSTLMNVLGCLDSPTEGDYYLLGKNVANMSEAALATIRNRQIGFVFQSFNLLSDLTALENVALPGRYRKLSTKQCNKLAEEALDRVGLSDRLNHLPTELSGGQQQRVAFARALVGNPPILLADEPTGNLDSKTGDEILNMIIDLYKQGTSVILVTHSQKVADVANRKITMKDGKVIADTDKEKTLA